MIKATGVMLIVTLFGIIIVMLGYMAGPEIEARAFPIVRSSAVAQSTARTSNSLCWMTHYRKLRNATPSYFDYRISHHGDHIPIAAIRIDNGKRIYLTTYGFAKHSAGETWDSRYCADMPSGIPKEDSFVLEGEGVYDVWHHLWNVRTPLPSIDVPGL